MWLFDYFVGSGLNCFVYMYIHVCFHVCFVLLCHFLMFCMYIVYNYIYVFMYMYICMCVYVYICMCIIASICLCLSRCVATHFYLYKSSLFNCFSCRYLGCYLLVWHCCLGSIVAFFFEFQNLNTTIFAKTYNKST